ncbi:hypothetical protein [Runella zeae]|uniref:hypothetical protein n=1 Tax=Runella zeae TaxID=94255 RepID=UPI0012FC58AD|nr:hypothetical protein [Runella zeae]
MTTEEAFRSLVRSRYRWVKMGGNDSTRLSLKARLEKGTLKLDTMTKYLKMAGYRLVTNPRWQPPKNL